MWVGFRFFGFAVFSPAFASPRWQRTRSLTCHQLIRRGAVVLAVRPHRLFDERRSTARMARAAAHRSYRNIWETRCPTYANVALHCILS
jgi:hypothetical protein